MREKIRCLAIYIDHFETCRNIPIVPVRCQISRGEVTNDPTDLIVVR